MKRIGYIVILIAAVITVASFQASASQPNWGARSAVAGMSALGHGAVVGIREATR